MRFIKENEKGYEITCEDGSTIYEQNSIAGIAVSPSLNPNFSYRNKPAFVINKKELRDLLNSKKAPDRVVNYVKNFSSTNVYMRYDKSVTFNFSKLFPKWDFHSTKIF